MPKPLIALDMDGVIAAFSELLLHVFNLRYSRKHGQLRIEDWKRYQIEDQYPPVVADLLYGIFREPGFFAALEAHADARAAVEGLLEFADIEVCSMPPSRDIDGNHVVDAHAAADKIGWLVRHFPELAGDVTLTKKKALLRTDALIDDSEKNIAKWCAAHPDGLGYLVARPWNEDAVLPANAVRGTFGETPAVIRSRLLPVGSTG